MRETIWQENCSLKQKRKTNIEGDGLKMGHKDRKSWNTNKWVKTWNKTQTEKELKVWNANATRTENEK